MTESNQITQTKFIQHLASDAEVLFTSTPDFASAMDALSRLLSASFIGLTTVYKDDHNLEYQFKTHLYATDKDNNANKYHLNKQVFTSLTPEMTNLLAADGKQQTMEKTKLMANLLPQVSYSESVNNLGSMFVIPIASGSDVFGFLSYEAPKQVDFEGQFSAAFHVLKSILVNTYRLKKSNIENDTYQTVLDLMPQRVFWKNKGSIYLGCNKPFSEDAALSNPGEIVGVTDYDIFPDQAELYRSDDANTMNTREHLICSDEPQTHKNGNTIWLRTSKRPIITSEDVVIGVVGTYDDITQLKNVQQELTAAKGELEVRVEARTLELSESNRKLEAAIVELKSTQDHLVETEKMAALGNLVSGVAHEINTPLGVAVTGASHLAELAAGLKNDVNTGNLSKQKFNTNCDEIIGSSDLILRNLERAADLIRNFKMIAVEQSNDQKQPIFFKKYLNDIIGALAPKSAAKNIKVFLTGDEEIKLPIYPAVMAQIVTILFDNALLHGCEDIDGGEIKLAFEVTTNELELIVQDNGKGVEPKLLTKIFEPFFSTTSDGQSPGAGLGLSIVYNLVTQKLNGQVTCRSRVNEYTQFIVKIPL